MAFAKEKFRLVIFCPREICFGLEAFKKTDAYKEFEIINKASQDLVGPDVDTEAALRLVKERLSGKSSKPNKVRRLWYRLSAAAILIISLGLFFTSSKTYTTAIGEQQTITLTDGSIVNLFHITDQTI